MSLWDDYGNPPINSTFVPVATPSTATLIAELDSTQLGTKDFVAGQKKLTAVKWILGADTNVTWQIGVCTSTALNAGRDEAYVKTPTAMSGEYVTEHELFKDERLRARLFSTGANAAAFITAKFKT